MTGEGKATKRNSYQRYTMKYMVIQLVTFLLLFLNHVLPSLAFPIVSKSYRRQEHNKPGICLIQMRMQDDGKDGMMTPPFLATAALITSLLAAWPLLSLMRDTNNPTDGFDIDMFISLKGMLENNNADALVDGYRDTIFELPPLSPADQLVGAIFGPP